MFLGFCYCICPMSIYTEDICLGLSYWGIVYDLLPISLASIVEVVIDSRSCRRQLNAYGGVKVVPSACFIVRSPTDDNFTLVSSGSFVPFLP